MRYLYTMTVGDERIKDSFLETVKNPIRCSTKSVTTTETKGGEVISEGSADVSTTYKPLLLKMDTCTGVKLGQNLTLKLFNKKTQSCMFTIDGFAQVINHDARTIKFYIMDIRVGI